MNEKHICCICGEEFIGFGNNPDPIKKEGRCCDICNNRVILARLRLASLTNVIVGKLKDELIKANKEEGIRGVNRILKKYNYDDLLIEE